MARLYKIFPFYCKHFLKKTIFRLQAIFKAAFF
jgi:hypothetical protein